MMDDQPIYRIQGGDGETRLNAKNGSVLVFDQEHAQKLAKSDFRGKGEVISVTKGVAPDLETRRHSGPYWRVDFSNTANTSIYVSGQTGEILERRNTYWRIRDFFWMLHTMDYATRDDFNNRLINIIILIAVWIGVSGFILLFKSFHWNDFVFLNPLAKQRMAGIMLKDPATGQSRYVRLRTGNNLFSALAANGVELPSVCGGGGECGKCRVQFDAGDLREANDIEKGLVPKPLRNRGFRLACQMEVQDGLSLVLPGSKRSDQGQTDQGQADQGRA
jgi:ferredoxin